MMATIKITRLESYPSSSPVGNCVGFTVSCNNGQSFYVDTVINYDRASGTNEAVELALQDLKAGINTRVSALEAASPLLNSDVLLPETDMIAGFEASDNKIIGEDGIEYTPTVVSSDTPDLNNGDKVIIEGSGEPSYNGTHQVLSIVQGISYEIGVDFVSNPTVKGTSKKNILEV